MRLCDCCSHIWRDGVRAEKPPVASWECRNGNIERLCLDCLNYWFDNADDDPDLEPASWSWLPQQEPEPSTLKIPVNTGPFFEALHLAKATLMFATHPDLRGQ